MVTAKGAISATSRTATQRASLPYRHPTIVTLADPTGAKTVKAMVVGPFHFGKGPSGALISASKLPSILKQFDVTICIAGGKAFDRYQTYIDVFCEREGLLSARAALAKELGTVLAGLERRSSEKGLSLKSFLTFLGAQQWRTITAIVDEKTIRIVPVAQGGEKFSESFLIGR